MSLLFEEENVNVITKDILTVKQGIIAHQVNMAGVMGAGLALKIREKWRKVYTRYRWDGVKLGECQIVDVGDGLFVANLCGQRGYGGRGRRTDYDALRQAMNTLSAYTYPRGLQVYLPHGIGCGLGGGDWTVVSGIIEDELPGAIVCRLPA
jgi:O-acetyl-ADP-ribose deacetylase (regulator of RNase III)